MSDGRHDQIDTRNEIGMQSTGLPRAGPKTQDQGITPSVQIGKGITIRLLRPEPAKGNATPPEPKIQCPTDSLQ